uniref:Polymeric immunoglobulin receptor n=1 Tax=Serinus canaria TaxID=9135 RepID=A0A8C9NBZ9_SERCA
MPREHSGGLEMVLLLLLAPTQLIQGQLHGSVTVLCHSGDTQRDQKRFWCKVGRSSCAPIASSDGFVGRRLQLTFESPPGSFRVTMTRMDWEDAGLYYCGAGEYGKDSTSKELDVFVYEGELLPGCFLLPLSCSSEASAALSLYSART